jgi:peptidoglycan/xylan/chitin deacetylase (PgdA/CDA1 family)
MHFLLTNDVESFSIPLNKCTRETAHEVLKVGLPRVLSLYAKHDVPATFYFTGELTETVPEAVDLVKDHGHEVGCHGYSHEVDMAFDVLSYDKQVSELKKAKTIIEGIAGSIESFRAPALRINEDTIKALVETGFTSDSSICPQRFDGPFTFGSKKKLKWLVAPRKPYYINRSSILEIPISALISPYIGTTMRVSPTYTRVLEKFIFLESKHTNKPVVFLFHPNECLDVTGTVVTTRRSNNPIKHFFADKLRQKMKLRNLGAKAIDQLDRVITSGKKHGLEFTTVKEYTKKYKVKP